MIKDELQYKRFPIENDPACDNSIARKEKKDNNRGDADALAPGLATAVVGMLSRVDLHEQSSASPNAGPLFHMVDRCRISAFRS
jgi:hypothetical protein